MHYKNGREAKNGDKVVLLPTYGPPVVGILYDAVAGNDYCNGKIAPPTRAQIGTQLLSERFGNLRIEMEKKFFRTTRVRI